MAPERSLEVPEGPGSAPEVSGMSRNPPRWSRKVLEASRRFRKVPEVYGQYHPLPPRPNLVGKPPWPAKGVGAHQTRGILLQVGIQTPHKAGFRWEGVGRFGRFWESKLDSPPTWAAPQAPWPPI